MLIALNLRQFMRGDRETVDCGVDTARRRIGWFRFSMLKHGARMSWMLLIFRRPSAENLSRKRGIFQFRQ